MPSDPIHLEDQLAALADRVDAAEAVVADQAVAMRQLRAGAMTALPANLHPWQQLTDRRLSVLETRGADLPPPPVTAAAAKGAGVWVAGAAAGVLASLLVLLGRSYLG